MKLSPKSEALAYRIWAYCEPRGWNVTVAEIAEELGVTRLRVTAMLGNKGWGGRVRHTWTNERGTYSTRASSAYDPLDFAGREFDSVREHLSDLATINA